MTRVGTADEGSARVRWRVAFAGATAGMWGPFVIAILLNHQVRRFWEDFWFWPGLLPGRYVFDDLYDDRFAIFVAVNLVLWTLVIKRWPVLGALGVVVHGTISALYLCALAAM